MEEEEIVGVQIFVLLKGEISGNVIRKNHVFRRKKFREMIRVARKNCFLSDCGKMTKENGWESEEKRN